jgi:tRNA-specific 2-thiouridylase
MVATGHYARIEKRGDAFHLLRGADTEKDQSYFLYGMTQEELAKTLFPVGHLTKEAVREEARSAGLVTADKPESQDICFVADSVSEFLIRIGKPRKIGQITDRSGKILGTHDGIEQFTVGQRRGVRVGGQENPLYVIQIIAEKNQVIVGDRSELSRKSFLVNDLNWISPPISTGQTTEFRALAQLRHRHRGVEVAVTVEAGIARCSFVNDWSTVSPGQAAVFYDLTNTEVLGGGRIVADTIY